MFMETVKLFNHGELPAEGWMALPVIVSQEPLEMNLDFHLSPAQLGKHKQSIKRLNASAQTCPFMKFQVRACPDCLAGKPCRARTFLQDAPKLKAQLQKLLLRWLPNAGDIDPESRSQYGLNDPHQFEMVLHGTDGTSDLAPLAARVKSLLSLRFPEFEVKLGWCPSCFKGHGEKHFAE